MRYRSDVAPATLSVEVSEAGVAVQYLDGREVFYHGRPEPTAGPVRTHRRTELHVLVTDDAAREGAMTYVNDRATHDDVLESTGVGRVLLDPGEREQLFPGVVVEMDGRVPVVDADHAVLDGRAFVFEESELGERSFELVADAGAGDGADSGGGPESDPGSVTDADAGPGSDPGVGSGR